MVTCSLTIDLFCIMDKISKYKTKDFGFDLKNEIQKRLDKLTEVGIWNIGQTDFNILCFLIDMALATNRELNLDYVILCLITGIFLIETNGSTTLPLAIQKKCKIAGNICAKLIRKSFNDQKLYGEKLELYLTSLISTFHQSIMNLINKQTRCIDIQLLMNCILQDPDIKAELNEVNTKIIIDIDYVVYVLFVLRSFNLVMRSSALDFTKYSQVKRIYVNALDGIILLLLDSLLESLIGKKVEEYKGLLMIIEENLEFIAYLCQDDIGYEGFEQGQYKNIEKIYIPLQSSLEVAIQKGFCLVETTNILVLLMQTFINFTSRCYADVVPKHPETADNFLCLCNKLLGTTLQPIREFAECQEHYKKIPLIIENFYRITKTQLTAESNQNEFLILNLLSLQRKNFLNYESPHNMKKILSNEGNNFYETFLVPFVNAKFVVSFILNLENLNQQQKSYLMKCDLYEIIRHAFLDNKIEKEQYEALVSGLVELYKNFRLSYLKNGPDKKENEIFFYFLLSSCYIGEFRRAEKLLEILNDFFISICTNIDCVANIVFQTFNLLYPFFLLNEEYCINSVKMITQILINLLNDVKSLENFLIGTDMIDEDFENEFMIKRAVEILELINFLQKFVQILINNSYDCFSVIYRLFCTNCGARRSAKKTGYQNCYVICKNCGKLDSNFNLRKIFPASEVISKEASTRLDIISRTFKTKLTLIKFENQNGFDFHAKDTKKNVCLDFFQLGTEKLAYYIQELVC